jgi:RNA polymerase sigma-70 factor, ECF subfamily
VRPVTLGGRHVGFHDGRVDVGHARLSSLQRRALQAYGRSVSLVTAERDDALLERLRAGNETAFAQLVERYSGALARVVRVYVPSTAVAEEVVQETWLAVLAGLDGFEGRSSLQTWLFRIAINRARTRGSRERRTVPFASLVDREIRHEASSVAPDRFLGTDHDRWPRHWATPPARWEDSPDRHLESAETVARVRAAIARLPPAQRLVITLRDIEGWHTRKCVTR